MNVSSINSISDARRAFAAEVNSGKPSTASLEKGSGKADDASRQARAASRQFEAIILRQLLSPAIEPLMSGGLTGGQSISGGGGGVYGYLVTDVMANSLSQGGGLGLSQMLEKQLAPRSAVSAAQAAATYGVGKVNSNE